MKTRMIYWAMMVAMFAFAACSNEELPDNSGDLEDFPEMLEEFKDDSAEIESLVTKIEKDTDLSYQSWWNGYESNYECFYSLDELENSPYAPLKDEIPQVDWDKQTLVIAYVYSSSTFDEDKCNVYGKSGKYTVEYGIGPGYGMAFDNNGVAIVLDKPAVEKKCVNFKVSIKGHDYE